MGEDEDFQLADSSTATTIAIWDTVPSCNEWGIQVTCA